MTIWKNATNRLNSPLPTKLENSATQQFNKYSAQAQAQIKKPGDYYWKQDTFYRGLFWIAVGLLVILWIVSGS